jgi:hypothetical protein
VPGDGLSGQAWDGGSVGANETWTVDATVVRTNATNQTIGGVKTFTSTISGSIDGQANNVANALTASTGLQFVLGTDYDGSSARALKVLYGTSSTTACIGNDSRLSDARPASSISTTTDGFVTTTAGNGSITINNSQAGYVANSLTLGTALSFATGSSYDGASSRQININFGTSGSTACIGNDSRLSDARPASSISTTTDGFVTTTAGNGSITIQMIYLIIILKVVLWQTL